MRLFEDRERAQVVLRLEEAHAGRDEGLRVDLVTVGWGRCRRRLRDGAASPERGDEARRRWEGPPMAVKPGWNGRFFEDFEVGDIYRCRIGRTVTQADNITFTLNQ